MRSQHLRLALAASMLAACSEPQVANPPPADVVANDLATADAPDTPDVDDAPDVSDAPDAPDADEALDAADVSDAPDARDAVEVAVDTGPPPCTSDADCAGSAGGPACDTLRGRCVQCRPGNEARCSASEYCVEATGRCAAGCRDDAACEATAGPGAARAVHCDTTMHRCLACFEDTHCPAGNICSASVCVPGCSATQPCMRGLTCCDAQCVDAASNAEHCGACDVACAAAHGAAGCSAGRCVVTACTAPYGDCDGDASNGCERDTSADLANCGACGNACASPDNVCVGGACLAADAGGT
jgi:hypothetical protein